MKREHLPARAARRMNRRDVLLGAGLGVAGTIVGAAVTSRVRHAFGPGHLPVTGGYAAAADDLSAIRTSAVTVRYYADTTEPVVALTFDDGPCPRWTPLVLDALEEAAAPATFFMVGRNVEQHADLVRDRLQGHEVGNHSWAHDDLATMDLARIRADLGRTHRMIQDELGRSPRLVRPPFGHLGGSTLLAADAMGCDVALWSLAAHERRYRADPPGLVADIVGTARPGSIILAHDAGDDRRLVTLNNIGAVVAGLRERGFRLATVSDMLASAGGTAPSP